MWLNVGFYEGWIIESLQKLEAEKSLRGLKEVAVIQ